MIDRKLKEAAPGAVYSSSSDGMSSSGELERRVREVTRQKEEEAARSEARVRREWEERPPPSAAEGESGG